jgi:DNA-binding Xre family transcriptional regulator
MVRVRIENRLKELLARKERKEKRKITQQTMAEETGTSLSSVHAWSKNAITRYDADHIAAFCQYLDCGVNDLLVLVEDDEETPEKKSDLPLAV